MFPMNFFSSGLHRSSLSRTTCQGLLSILAFLLHAVAAVTEGLRRDHFRVKRDVVITALCISRIVFDGTGSLIVSDSQLAEEDRSSFCRLNTAWSTGINPNDPVSQMDRLIGVAVHYVKTVH